MPAVASKAILLALAAMGTASDVATEGACLAGDVGAACGGDHALLQVRPARVSQQKTEPLGWPGTGAYVAAGDWCQGEVPTGDFDLKRCGASADAALEVKVLTYNLFWWNLFGIHGGNGGSAGRLIAEHQEGVPYDLMAFQECDDVNRILQDAKNAGLSGDYAAIAGNHALGIVYRSSSWQLLGQSTDDVAEDRAEQWYGNRGAEWARLQHTETGKTVMLVNHHGPLPVNTGGKCGGKATAFNILRTVATHSHQGDSIILVGDFNAMTSSDTIPALEERLHRTFTGYSMGGIDHIFSSSCTGSGRRLGTGGSDHEALDAVITI